LGLDRVWNAARQRKKEKFTALLHHVTVELLRESFLALKRRAAPGVDGVTWEDYEVGLEDNLQDLHARVHGGGYRALPVRRRFIPKPGTDKQRPLGIAALEDKIVQRALVAVLNAIYEEDVCYERDRSQVERKRCFIKDEGGPVEVGLQEQASNRLKLRRLRAVVVSVDGKGGARLRQVRVEKTNASEPLMTCRNVLTEVETGIWTSIPRARLGTNLSTAQLASGMKAA
jgi:hypothetical protein